MNNILPPVLSALFCDAERPTITEIENAADKAVIKLYIPPTLSWFEGHFPDQKVLPGVVQVDWVGKFGKAIFADTGTFCQLSNIKFKTMIMPGMSLSLELRYQPDKQSLKFNYFDNDVTFSSGSFKYSTS